MAEINLKAVNYSLLRKQHLTDNSKTADVVQIIEDVGGLHATIPKTPYLSLFSRAKNFARKQLDEELYEKRSISKIRCMRKTVYILPKQMLSIAYSATKMMVELSSEHYSRYLGVTEKDYMKLSQLILGLLKGRGMTAKEIKNELATDLNVSAVLNLMCDQGLLIRGNPRNGWKSSLHTYYLFNDYFPDVNLKEPDEDRAVELLVHYYLDSFGPVTENDIVWWTGLTKTVVQRALKKLGERLVSVNIDGLGDSFLVLHSDMALENVPNLKSGVVNLLPPLDSYIMGYKERERFLSNQHYCNVFDQSGNAAPTILLDGKVAGVWSFTADKKPVVKFLFFEQVENSVLTEVYSKAQKIGKFISDKEVTVTECSSMLPLTRRTAGTFMSPLKNC